MIGDTLLTEKVEENKIDAKEITSSIITNPFGIINLPYDGSVGLNSFERILEEKLSSSYKIFWFFGIYKEIIRGNKYIRDNQTIVSGWMHYKLICYLQKRNPNVPAIPFKITAPGKRDLRDATKLWKEINRDRTISDIYTGRQLTEENFSTYGELSIDHFIPWSFVLHDELWNLAPTFKNINSQKSNKLPDLSSYMDKFCEIQYESFDIMQRNHKMYKKNLEGILKEMVLSSEKFSQIRQYKDNKISFINKNSMEVFLQAIDDYRQVLIEKDEPIPEEVLLAGKELLDSRRKKSSKNSR